MDRLSFLIFPRPCALQERNVAKHRRYKSAYTFATTNTPQPVFGFEQRPPPEKLLTSDSLHNP